jgi:hypothetical protein
MRIDVSCHGDGLSWQFEKREWDCGLDSNRAIRGGGIHLAIFPRISSVSADSILGYFRSLPPGGSASFERLGAKESASF